MNTYNLNLRRLLRQSHAIVLISYHYTSSYISVTHATLTLLTGKSVVSCIGSGLWMDNVKCGQCRRAVAVVVVFSAAADCRVETTEYLAVDWRWGISNTVYKL